MLIFGYALMSSVCDTPWPMADRGSWTPFHSRYIPLNAVIAGGHNETKQTAKPWERISWDYED
jgi:hypothetical protein